MTRDRQQLTGEARKFWRRNAPRLRKLGLLNDQTREAFALLCLTWEKLCEVKPEDGIKWVCLAKQVQQLMSSFGMHPAAMQKLRISIDSQETADDELGL